MRENFIVDDGDEDDDDDAGSDVPTAIKRKRKRREREQYEQLDEEDLALIGEHHLRAEVCNVMMIPAIYGRRAILRVRARLLIRMST